MLRSPSYRRDLVTGVILMILIWVLLFLGSGLLSKGHGMPLPGSRSAVFPPAGPSIRIETVRALIEEDLDRRGYDGERTVDFPDAPAGIAWLPGETGFRVTSPTSEARLGPVSFYVEMMAGEKVARVLPVEVWVRLFREQAVTLRALSRGETVTPDAVGTARVEVNDAGDAGFATGDECVGLRVKRSLPSGWTLASRDLERMPAVKRGQRMRVTYRQGAVVAAATVEVKADGWVGDAVPVINLDSRRGFTALVVGPGQLRAVAGS